MKHLLDAIQDGLRKVFEGDCPQKKRTNKPAGKRTAKATNKRTSEPSPEANPKAEEQPAASEPKAEGSADALVPIFENGGIYFARLPTGETHKRTRQRDLRRLLKESGYGVA